MASRTGLKLSTELAATGPQLFRAKPVLEAGSIAARPKIFLRHHASHRGALEGENPGSFRR